MLIYAPAITFGLFKASPENSPLRIRSRRLDVLPLRGRKIRISKDRISSGSGAAPLRGETSTSIFSLLFLLLSGEEKLLIINIIIGSLILIYKIIDFSGPEIFSFYF